MSSPSMDEMLLDLMAERDAEFNRIARMLHDEVGQVLSAVGLQLDALRLDFRAQAPDIEQRTTEIQQMLETVIGRIREVSYELNPSIVQRTGLQFALERLSGRFRQGFSGAIRCQMDPTVRIPRDQAESFYRLVESAFELATSAPHATLIELQLKRSRQYYVLEMHCDCRPEFESESRFAALFMRYYARRHDIALSLSASGEKGTIIRFSCPIPSGEQS